jgi:hypothetical protein
MSDGEEGSLGAVVNERREESEDNDPKEVQELSAGEATDEWVGQLQVYTYTHMRREDTR